MVRFYHKTWIWEIQSSYAIIDLDCWNVETLVACGSVLSGTSSQYYILYIHIHKSSQFVTAYVEKHVLNLLYS